MPVVQNRNDDNGDVTTNRKTTVPEDCDEIREYEQCGCQIGCGSCKSKRLICSVFNCCNNAKGVLVFLSAIAFFQGFVMNGLINIVITTLERRFSLSSSETGLIASSYDIGSCLSLLFVTYVGGRGHKPLWLGWGTLIMGIGSIVFSLPHFIAPAYNISNDVSCANMSTATCGESSIRVYRGFFILSQLLHGIGATPLYTLALTYLDENVKQVYSSMYHGIFYCLSVVGPGIGYLLGGQLLNMYTNPGETVSISPDSVLWVGNWWVGFLIGGVCFFVLSIPLLMYPRQLPGTDRYRIGRENEMHQNSDAVALGNDEEFGKSFRDFPRALLILFRNPTIILISLGGAMDNGIVAGIATFGPKYLESMFSLSASYAAFVFGLLAIVSAALGQIIGGVIVTKFKLTVRKMLGMIIVFSCISLGCFFIFILRCENTDFVGISNVVSCNTSSCSGCSTDLYDPVCGSDKLTYLSYCDAKCDQINSTNFENCDEVFNSAQINNISRANAIRGKCAQNACPNMEVFAVVIALGVFFVFMTAQPALQSSLRSVPFSQRSFAIGIQWLILRLLGSVPMPNILGRVLDLSCEVWGIKCDECGSCKVYDNADMSKYMTIVIVVAKFIAVVFFIAAWFTYKPPNNEERESTPLEPTTAATSNARPEDKNGIETTEVVEHSKPLTEDRRESQAHDNPNFEP